MRTTGTVAAASTTAAAVVALILPGSATAAPSESTAVDCPRGHVCFYTGAGFTGSKCQWDEADPDWQGGSIRCSWSATRNVKSVFNNGTSSRFTGVAYYGRADYRDRKGCTRQQHGGNLAGTYKLRSHRWITGSCG